MKARKALVVGALVAALAVPAGVAVAASTPSPGPGTGNSQGAWPGHGHDHMQGGMMGRMATGGGPADCPFRNTDEMGQMRDQREERGQMPPQDRQNSMGRHHDRMGTPSSDRGNAS